MLDHALALLGRTAVPQLLAAHLTAAGHLAALEYQLKEVEQRIPLWDRLVFFRDSPDEELAASIRLKLDALRPQVAAAREQLEQALTAAFAESPPIEIAVRVERVLAAVKTDPGLGRRNRAEEPLASELEAIAARVVEVWVPDFDGVQLASLLAHDQARTQAASHVAGPVREDWRLGWAAVSMAELGARAAAWLNTEAFGMVRAAVAREAAHQQVVDDQLRQAREQVSTLDRITPGESAAEKTVATLEQSLGKEQRELMAATETFHHALELALSSFPPMGVYLAALAAAGAIRTANPGAETVLTASGGITAVPDSTPRAVLLATLVELTTAVETAFPGISSHLSSRRGRRRGADDGPYREAAPSPEAQAQQPTAATADDGVLADLERWNLRPLLTRGVAHASMLGSIARNRQGVRSQIGWSDRLAVWSNTPQEQVNSELAARQEWHAIMLGSVCRQATQIVGEAARQSPRHALGFAAVAAHGAASAISTRTGNSSSPISCPAHGKAALLSALESARQELERGFGTRGDRQTLVHAVLSHLQRAPAVSPVQPGQPPRPLRYEQIVVAVAEQLRSTEFVALQQRLFAAQQQYESITAGARKAGEAVSFWDKLNVFTKSPEEQLRDDLDAQAEQLFASISADGRRANTLLDQALNVYPPADAYYDLLTVMSNARSIRAEQRRGTTTTRIGKTTTRRTYYYCVLIGKDLAESSLRRWSARLVRYFGSFTARGDLLERWVARELGG